MERKTLKEIEDEEVSSMNTPPKTLKELIELIGEQNDLVSAIKYKSLKMFHEQEVGILNHKWISVDERLPEYEYVADQFCLDKYYVSDGDQVLTAYFSKGRFGFTAHEIPFEHELFQYKMDNITHWMLIPAIPNPPQNG